MTQEQWSAVDRYIVETQVESDAALERALQRSREAGLPEISVAPNQGKLLQLLVRLQGAKNILEIGTLGGYSTIWLARALPKDGRLLSLELDPKHAGVARENLEQAGLGALVEVRVGRALDSLAQLGSEQRPAFDFVFIDADKENIEAYFDWALKLARPGSAIVVDNVVRRGAVVDPHSSDRNVQGVRKFYERLAKETRVSATTVQTVGSKGYDGFTLAIVEGAP